MSQELVKVTINGAEIETQKGSVLIDVCRDNAENIPSFCYYKDLEPQASCRMCLVRIDKMPKLQTSCTIKVTDGMVVTTKSPEIEKAQRAMGEFLLTNHPLDCPVCDRGGECELQEVIFDWGDVEERFSEDKDAAPEKYLSPIVANDPQRCILCKRCTRVCSEWMGEDAIEAGNRGASTVIGTYGGWLNCSQCGNCIEVCPTGTLLDGVYRHETRPWELDQTITTDVYGSDGMQLSIGSRGGLVHRIVARDRYVNGFNGEFLDVRARFAHEFINHKDRIKTPLIRYKDGGKLIPATWDEAISVIARELKEYGPDAGVIASPRLTNESIFLLSQLADKAIRGGFAVSDRGHVSALFENLSVPINTPEQIRYAKTIVLIGGEPEEEQPYAAKQIRQAVKNNGARFVVVNDRPIRLTDRASQFLHINPDSYDAFALAFADTADDATLKKIGVESDAFAKFADAMNSGEGDLVILVSSDLSSEAQAVIANAAANFSGENRQVFVQPLAAYNNSVGANDVAANRQPIDELLGKSKALLIAGSLPDASKLSGKQFIAVQELFETETTSHADVVLPAASFAEVDGTFTNNNGFVQRVRKAIEPIHQSKPDWMIAMLIARELGHDFGYEFSASSIFRSIADATSAYSGLRYPMLKDESKPVQAAYSVSGKRDLSNEIGRLRERTAAMSDSSDKITKVPRIGHKLHRLTTMTSKTPQFHLLANGNPKPESLLVAPLAQLDLDGKPKSEAVAVAAGDRE